MDSLIYSLNSTVPIFLVMAFGMILKKLGKLSDGFISTSNWLVFNIALPIKVYMDLADMNLHEDFDVGYVMFCFVVTLVSILSLWGAAHIFIKDKASIGAFVQAAYRSSAAILGVPFVENLFGNAGMIPLMILGAVPLYNVFAVIILTLENPELKGDLKARVLTAFVRVAKNPIIIGIVVGILGAAIRLDLPAIVDKSMNYMANLTSPLALLAIGASFDGQQAIGKLKETAAASFMKLVGLEMIFLPLAIYCGYEGQKLLAIVIMLGSPATPSGYVMVKNMGGDDVLASGAVVLTTLFSAISLTFWIFLIRYMGLI